jgi:predicted MFS family arabinose efflux permease
MPTHRLLVPSLMFIVLVVAVVGSLGAPLITSVSITYGVPLDAAQWTLTITLLTGAMATPILGRLGAGSCRRQVIIGTLIIIFTGSVLTVLPLSFVWLLIGRAAQGIGLSLTALMMGVARDQLDRERATSTIALLSVASTAGIGVGYPLAGLLTDIAGLRAAYGLGVLVTGIALIAAWMTIPEAPAGRTTKGDLPGALMLVTGLLALLIVISERSIWAFHPAIAVILLVIAVLLLVLFVWYERRTTSPLVDLTLLRHPAVVGANLIMFLGGIGMYLLLTLVIRYVQTPASVGYGFGATVFLSGLVLVPFSALGFVGGKITSLHRNHMPSAVILSSSSTIVFIALTFFALSRFELWESFATMGLLGFGVGTFSAAMPEVILIVTPASETSAAMSFNQIVRSIGFSIGSALSGLVLSAYTLSGQTFPTECGYTAAAWVGAAAMIVTTVVSLVLRRTSAKSHTT